jgi:predicted phosphodiesterase
MAPSTAITQALDRVLAETGADVRTLDPDTDRYVIFSDHHKGRRDGADDFARCEASYLAALEHYRAAGHTLILLGDAEELWENRVEPVLSAYANVLAAERQFHPERLLKIWGNHDDEWASPKRIAKHLPPVFGAIDIPEGVQFDVVRGGRPLGTLLLLHGHQGTLFSDRLAGIAKLAVRFVWRTIQRLTRMPSTTPASDACLRDAHDRAMYRWASTKAGLVLVAGHTHRPVFSSKTHLQQLAEEIDDLRSRERPDDATVRRIAELEATVEKVRQQDRECEEAVADDPDRSRPCYFNTGCCCFADGDVTGIELAEGEIRLVRWGLEHGALGRRLLAYTAIDHVFDSLAPRNGNPGSDET